METQARQPGDLAVGLYHKLIDVCLVGGVDGESGWGRVVRDDVLPLLGHPKLAHHAAILADGFRRSADPIAVFVVGEGKFGKSTLINALAGAPVAVVDFLPCTWHITRYTPADLGPRYEVHFDPSAAGAGRLEESCRRTGRDTRVRAGVASFNSAEHLQQVVAEEESHVKKSKGASAIWQVVRSLPSGGPPGAVMEFVDTPGLSQVRVGSAGQEGLDDFYHRADVVLWLLAADKLNSAQTRESLKAMSRYGKPIVGVVNRADLIPPAARPRVLDEVRSTFEGLLTAAVLVSARDGFTAFRAGNEQAHIASGLPELRSVIGRLAGNRGARTKALSLYTTSRQAAHEARAILEQEAQVLEQNLARYATNLATAEGYAARARAVLNRETATAQAPIHDAAHRAMQNTADLYGDDNTPLFDESAVKQAVRAAGARVLESVSAALRRELATVQDEIAGRGYDDQSYGGDATVKSHTSSTSFEMPTGEIGQSLALPPIEPRWDFRGVVAAVVEKAKQAWDWWARNTGLGTERTEREKRHDKREPRLQQHLRSLPAVADAYKAELVAAANRAIDRTTAALAAEVTRCFDQAFGSKQIAKDNVALWRRQAKGAVVPPPLLYGAVKLLGGEAATGHAFIATGSGGRKRRREKSHV